LSYASIKADETVIQKPVTFPTKSVCRRLAVGSAQIR